MQKNKNKGNTVFTDRETETFMKAEVLNEIKLINTTVMRLEISVLCAFFLFMAYFLKKTNNKKGIYLQIYESYYDSERKGGAHRSYKPIGYVHELQANGIEDPISFFGEEVQKLNQEHKKKKQVEKRRQISDESPEKLLGYFPLKNLNDSLKSFNCLIS